MADREYIVTFNPETGRATVRFPGTGDHTLIEGQSAKSPRGEYHVKAPSVYRAEQIARAMRGGKK